MDNVKLMVTLIPSFPHFKDFCADQRLAGIRMNCATLEPEEIKQELALLNSHQVSVPLYYDAKGRQMRVEKVHFNPDYLDLTLNHAISVRTPTRVLFKAGEDWAWLERVEEGGRRLIFQGGPQYMVRMGESLHIRHSSLQIHRPYFTDAEMEKIEIIKRAGFKKFFLSYVSSVRYVDEFLDIVGKDSELILKIEDLKGLDFVANEFQKRDNLKLVAALGDLYVEIDRPHEIVNAIRLITEKDPEACVGSRMLLSTAQVVVPPKTLDAMHEVKGLLEGVLSGRLSVKEAKAKYSPVDAHIPEPKDPIPSCADFSMLAWFYDLGYRTMMLCDDLCIHGNLLHIAVNAFDEFRMSYQGQEKARTKKVLFRKF